MDAPLFEQDDHENIRNKVEARNRSIINCVIFFVHLHMILDIIFSIASIYIGLQDFECDKPTPEIFNLRVSDYLLVNGIQLLFISHVLRLIIKCASSRYEKHSATFDYCEYIRSMASGTFFIIWIIFGCVFIFKTNIDCVSSSNPEICFAIFTIFYQFVCCSEPPKFPEGYEKI